MQTVPAALHREHARVARCVPRNAAVRAVRLYVGGHRGGRFGYGRGDVCTPALVVAAIADEIRIGHIFFFLKNV